MKGIKRRSQFVARSADKQGWLDDLNPRIQRHQLRGLIHHDPIDQYTASQDRSGRSFPTGHQAPNHKHTI
jgi:hypothetical protein